MMPEYVVVAHDPHQTAIGDHITDNRQDAIDYASHFLDDEERTGACVTITVVSPDTDDDQLARSDSRVDRSRWPQS